MPGLDRILRNNHPDLARKLIYLTGDVVNDATREFLQNCGRPFLTKPFQFESVKRVIEDVIAEGSGPDADHQSSTAV